MRVTFGGLDCEPSTLTTEVTLSPNTIRVIEDHVKAGDYPDASAVVTAAVAEFDGELERIDNDTLAAIRDGQEQIARGEEIDYDTFRKDLLTKVRSR